jgi:hypothetical protein
VKPGLKNVQHLSLIKIPGLLRIARNDGKDVRPPSFSSLRGAGGDKAIQESSLSLKIDSHVVVLHNTGVYV